MSLKSGDLATTATTTPPDVIVSAPDPKSGDLATTTPDVIPDLKSGKKPHGLCGRKASEAQMAALRRGMAALKTRREAISAAKEAGTFDPMNFVPKPKVIVAKPPPKPKADPFTGIVREKVFVPRKKQETRLNVEFAELRKTMEEFRARIEPPPPKEVIREVPVDRIVEKEVVRETKVSGRDLLDAIFFKK